MNPKELSELLTIPKLTAYINQLDEKLESSLDSANSTLKKPSLRVIQSGGKRLRPSLLIASSLCQHPKISDKTIDAGIAIELLHIASLIHDDIIDQADTRHSAKTISSNEGIDTAILAGDYLLAKANQLAAETDQDIAKDVAATFAAMCNGQSQELVDRHNLSRTVNSYLHDIKNKTARLISTACRSGGICAGMPVKYVEALAEYGECFGMTVQLIDDLLDLLSNSKSLGKPTQNDIREGIYTMPVLLCLQSKQADELKLLLSKKILGSTDNQKIVNLLETSGSINKTLEVASHYNSMASNALKILKQTAVVKGMAELPERYMRLALKNRRANP